MLKSYTLLHAFRENLPDADVSEDEVVEYHEILDTLDQSGFETTDYRIPDTKLKQVLRSYNYVTGGDREYSQKRYCKRDVLLRKIDALLLRFKLISKDVDVEIIGFTPSESNS